MITLIYLLSFLLLSQNPPMTDNEYFEWRLRQQELEQDRLRTLTASPISILFTLVLRDAQGAAAPGYIHCEGFWWTHTDTEKEEPAGGFDMQFRTDSRGAVPFLTGVHAYDDDPEQTCQGTSRERHGSLTFYPTNHGIYPLTVR